MTSRVQLPTILHSSLVRTPLVFCEVGSAGAVPQRMPLYGTANLSFIDLSLIGLGGGVGLVASEYFWVRCLDFFPVYCFAFPALCCY